IAKNKEFQFRAEVRHISDTRILQVLLGTLGNPARITTIGLALDGVIHVANKGQRLLGEEGVNDSGAQISKKNQVGLVNALEAAHARPVKAEAILEQPLVHAAQRKAVMLHHAANIGETDI